MVNTLIDTDKKKIFLFFDLEITGHHIEYISHLIRFSVNNELNKKFIFLINQLAVEILDDYSLPENWKKMVVIEHPKSEEIEELSKTKSKIKKADKELAIVKRVGEKYSIDTCCLMSLNKYQLALGRQIGKSLPGNIRGILFNPMGNPGKFPNNFLFALRKKAQIYWMLRNRKVNRIFFLNDQKKTDEFNILYKNREIFTCLPDPVQPLTLPSTEDLNARRGENKHNNNRIKLLLFGSLSERKGIFTLLDALKIIDPSTSSRLEIIFAGIIVKKSRNAFINQINSIKENNKKIKITHVDKFLTNKEAANLFSGTDYVLAPYIGSEASSGIIGHAAFYKKPVIGTDNGLLGILINDYKLGIAIKPINAQNIASTLKYIANIKRIDVQSDGMNKFVEERHPDRFVEHLLN
jgi:glycosyltransferase involved in cell wall biosynthesis